MLDKHKEKHKEPLTSKSADILKNPIFHWAFWIHNIDQIPLLLVKWSKVKGKAQKVDANLQSNHTQKTNFKKETNGWYPKHPPNPYQPECVCVCVLVSFEILSSTKIRQQNQRPDTLSHTEKHNYLIHFHNSVQYLKL